MAWLWEHKRGSQISLLHPITTKVLIQQELRGWFLHSLQVYFWLLVATKVMFPPSAWQSFFFFVWKEKQNHKLVLYLLKHNYSCKKQQSSEDLHGKAFLITERIRPALTVLRQLVLLTSQGGQQKGVPTQNISYSEVNVLCSQNYLYSQKENQDREQAGEYKAAKWRSGERDPNKLWKEDWCHYHGERQWHSPFQARHFDPFRSVGSLRRFAMLSSPFTTLTQSYLNSLASAFPLMDS